MENIEIKLVKQWDTNQIVDLYRAGNWWEEYYNPNELPNLIENSFAFVVAVDTSLSKAIGMGRVISDGISDAYIQDVVVLPTYRRHEIGKQIIEILIKACHQQKIEWIGLIAEPGSVEFYNSLDFSEMKDHVPMLYKKRRHI
jgi:ribosomal protein S18 acetylase RimI-like enzyme